MSVMRRRAGVMAGERSDQRARVLVAEGDVGTSDAVSAVLRHAGHHVERVAGAREAHSLLGNGDRGAYDIVLVGLEEDRALGDELVRVVRERCPEASIILLAGYAELEAALAALRTGIDAYLMKPVDVEELRTATERALERQRLRRALVAAQSREHALEAQLRQQGDGAREDLQRRVRELEQANRELREAQEQNDRFVAMVAHEMRSLLNPIISYAQLAVRPSLPSDKLNTYMTMIVDQAFRVNRLNDDLSTATRLSTGQFSLRRDWTDLADAVAAVIEQFTSSVHERRFSLERPAEPVMAYVDRDRIMQAVRNLVDNAVKYSAERGAIEVRVWTTGDQVCVSVADYGMGLSEEEMLGIFEPFIRGSRGREVAGSGLGLYITRGITEAHGGQLTVANRTGGQRVHGAIFTMSLPIGQAERGEA